MEHKLPIEIKTKWLEALRSDKYEQGRSSLCNKDGRTTYCCLGVLCDLIDPNGWQNSNLGSIHWHEHYGEPNYQYFPAEVAQALCQDTVAGPVQNRLMRMNDVPDPVTHETKSFTDIAKWIEENL